MESRIQIDQLVVLWVDGQTFANKEHAIKYYINLVDTHDLFWVQKVLLDMQGGDYFRANKYKSLPGVQLFVTVQEIVNASRFANAYLRRHFRSRFGIDCDKILHEHRAGRREDHPYNLTLPVAREMGLDTDTEFDDTWDSDDSEGLDNHFAVSNRFHDKC